MVVGVAMLGRVKEVERFLFGGGALLIQGATEMVSVTRKGGETGGASSNTSATSIRMIKCRPMNWAMTSTTTSCCWKAATPWIETILGSVADNSG